MISRFHSACSSCSHRRDCFSATRLSAGSRQAFFATKGYRVPTNDAMREGIRKHREFQQKIKSLEEYGVSKFKKDLYSGKKIRLSEVRVCSPSNGLRGIIDVLNIRFDKKEKRFVVYVEELKSSFQRKHFMQILTYALMFNDWKARLVYERVGKRGGKSFESFLLYPKLNSGFKIRVDAVIFIFGKGYGVPIRFVDDNVFGDGYVGMVNGFYRLLKKRRKDAEMSVEDFWKVRPCKKCYKEKCGYYDRFCSKLDEDVVVRTRQKYFGKKKLLVNSKPRSFW